MRQDGGAAHRRELKSSARTTDPQKWKSHLACLNHHSAASWLAARRVSAEKRVVPRSTKIAAADER